MSQKYRFSSRASRYLAFYLRSSIFHSRIFKLPENALSILEHLRIKTLSVIMLKISTHFHQKNPHFTDIINADSKIRVCSSEITFSHLETRSLQAKFASKYLHNFYYCKCRRNISLFVRTAYFNLKNQNSSPKGNSNLKLLQIIEDKGFSRIIFLMFAETRQNQDFGVFMGLLQTWTRPVCIQKIESSHWEQTTTSNFRRLAKTHCCPFYKYIN